MLESGADKGDATPVPWSGDGIDAVRPPYGINKQSRSYL